jgi:8-oxo-dGTP pyrophosphatase MutT (NUDIX family)
MPDTLGKVTAFITRDTDQGFDLLLFEHPYAGIQIPAGTIEDGETPEAAVQREAREESGLSPLSVKQYLGSADLHLPEGRAVVTTSTHVYAHPNLASIDWAHFPKGIAVTIKRREPGFCQVGYEELDRVPDPQYTSMMILGWVPDHVLVSTIRRHFFHLEFSGSSSERWTVSTDNHEFTLFWAPLTALPRIITPRTVGWRTSP